MSLHDLAKRPERDPLAVRQTAALPPGDELRTRIDVTEELGDDPAFPEPRLARHRHELHRPRDDRLVEDRPEDREVSLTADKGCVVCTGEIRAEASAGSPGVEHPHRLGLALQRG
jgi:hypothetical protein